MARKTKVQIKEMIKQIRTNRNNVEIPAEVINKMEINMMTHKSFAQNLYSRLMDSQIQALEWAIGFNENRDNWCVPCQSFHTGLDCPKCSKVNKLDHTLLAKNKNKEEKK